MPIVDVHSVVSASHELPENAAQLLADLIARVLKFETGRVWVRMIDIPKSRYAENGEVIEDEHLPVFVQIMHADPQDKETRIQEAQTLAGAVAAILGRQVERVHIEYAQAGRGRVAFGGKLVV